MSCVRENRCRPDDPNDYVRIEIQAALERSIPVTPVLVDGADMPRIEDLPHSLKDLTRKNGICGLRHLLRLHRHETDPTELSALGKKREAAAAAEQARRLAEAETAKAGDRRTTRRRRWRKRRSALQSERTKNVERRKRRRLFARKRKSGRQAERAEGEGERVRKEVETASGDLSSVVNWVSWRHTILSACELLHNKDILFGPAITKKALEGAKRYLKVPAYEEVLMIDQYS